MVLRYETGRPAAEDLIDALQASAEASVNLRSKARGRVVASVWPYTSSEWCDGAWARTPAMIASRPRVR